MYDHVVKCQRAGLCLSEHFLIFTLWLGHKVGLPVHRRHLAGYPPRCHQWFVGASGTRTQI